VWLGGEAERMGEGGGPVEMMSKRFR